MKTYLIRILLGYLIRTLDLPKDIEREDQGMEDWMAGAWMSPGFRKYVGFRAAKIRAAMSGGEGMLPEPRDQYVRHSGQLVEILLFGQRAKEAHQRKEKKKEESLSTPL